MRVLLVTGWLLLPLIGAAWHYGPGQEKMHLDEAAAVLAEADKAAADKQWLAADEKYEEALKLLPTEQTAKLRQVRLERAKVQMLARKLPTAHQDLKGLVFELMADPAADPKLLADARSTLANAQYYMTWLMRLEGVKREEWEPEIESARQNFTLLAEQSVAKGDTEAVKKHEEDLESAIRLARMDLKELQGLPLPSQ